MYTKNKFLFFGPFYYSVIHKTHCVQLSASKTNNYPTYIITQYSLTNFGAFKLSPATITSQLMLMYSEGLQTLPPQLTTSVDTYHTCHTEAGHFQLFLCLFLPDYLFLTSRINILITSHLTDNRCSDLTDSCLVWITHNQNYVKSHLVVILKLRQRRFISK